MYPDMGRPVSDATMPPGFNEDLQTDWSIHILSCRTLPVDIPATLNGDLAVPVAFVVEEPFGAGMHLLLWSDDEEISPRCDVEVLFRSPSDGWRYAGSGGSAWPTSQLVDLDDDELGQPFAVMGECSIGTPLGVPNFTYGVVSKQYKGIQYIDNNKRRNYLKKMRCGAFIVPSLSVDSRLETWR